MRSGRSDFIGPHHPPNRAKATIPSSGVCPEPRRSVFPPAHSMFLNLRLSAGLFSLLVFAPLSLRAQPPLQPFKEDAPAAPAPAPGEEPKVARAQPVAEI